MFVQNNMDYKQDKYLADYHSKISQITAEIFHIEVPLLPYFSYHQTGRISLSNAKNCLTNSSNSSAASRRPLNTIMRRYTVLRRKKQSRLNALPPKRLRNSKRVSRRVSHIEEKASKSRTILVNFPPCLTPRTLNF